MRLTRLVSATRLSQKAFWETSLLGRSLIAMPVELRPELALAFENRRGLPCVYNDAIDACPADKNLLFVHDDVYLHDTFLQHRIAEGLQRFDVLGVAGSRGSDLNQPSWALAFDEFLRFTNWQKGRHIVPSGIVSHIHSPHDHSTPGWKVPPAIEMSMYGNVPSECELLDGVFLAIGREKLGSLRFDTRFSFHLYDLDFCRSATSLGLRLGTWPILLTHESLGNFGTEDFKAAARTYLQKWAEHSREEKEAAQ